MSKDTKSAVAGENLSSNAQGKLSNNAPVDMSKAVLDIAWGMIEELNDDELMGGAIVFATTAWNIALVTDKQKREKMIQDCIQMVRESEFNPGLDIDDDLANVLEKLIANKLELYPHVWRFITHSEIINPDRNNLDIRISATIDLDEEMVQELFFADDVQC
ncbi:MAG: hypothetical protein QG673_2137 [Pseudomonadota bacterium]|nr:hypothetical protein [Pseudomonadota bacterium]